MWMWPIDLDLLESQPTRRHANEHPIRHMAARLGTNFRVGEQYARRDIYRILNVPEDEQRGDWDTGYHLHGDTFFVFCNVGVAGRTGHDYSNGFDGDELVWWAKNNRRLGQDQMAQLLERGREVLIFWRSNSGAPFHFAGTGWANDVKDAANGQPVFVRWVFAEPGEAHPERPAEELPPGQTFPEGAAQKVLVNRYERNPAARAACIAHHGCRCVVCGFDFEAVYGELGKGFIHVHHVVPLGTIKEDYDVNPVTDMVPVCPNCHAMIHHRSSSAPLDWADLRSQLGQS